MYKRGRDFIETKTETPYSLIQLIKVQIKQAVGFLSKKTKKKQTVVTEISKNLHIVKIPPKKLHFHQIGQAFPV